MSTDLPERRFRVLLKRVTYAEVHVEAQSAKQAQELVEQEGAHEHFVLSNTIDSDTTTVVSVKREPLPAPNRSQGLT